MVDTVSWGWHVNSVWPGFSMVSDGNLDARGNGLSIDPATYTDLTWRDPEGDDQIADSDLDDASVLTSDRIVIDGTPHIVREIASFAGGSMVIKGVTYSVNFAVWLLDDGTYVVRISDSDIPPNLNHSQVTSLTLGTFSGVEYSHSFVSTRDAPFVCFVAGTLIHTLRGLRNVQDLRVGELVLTADHGYRPIRWIGKRIVSGLGSSAPVRFRKGALGNTRDLWVSQQHRMVVKGWQSELLLGLTEVLVAAVYLVNGSTIDVEQCDQVTYVHILFDDHEIIFAEGVPTESFHPGSFGMSVLDLPTKSELLEFFPELDRDTVAYGATARPCLKPWEARALGFAQQ